MRRYWTIPVTIVAALLVAFVVARDLALLVVEDKQKAAVAHLSARFDKPLGPANEDLPRESPPQDAQGDDTSETQANAEWEPILAQAAQKWSACLEKYPQFFKRMWNYVPATDTPFTLPPDEAGPVEAYFAENDAYMRQALELLEREPIPQDLSMITLEVEGGMGLLALVSTQAVVHALDKEVETAAREVLAVEKQREGCRVALTQWNITCIEVVPALVETGPGLELAGQVARAFARVHAREGFVEDYFHKAHSRLGILSGYYPKVTPIRDPVIWVYTTAFRPIYERDLTEFCTIGEKMLDLADKPFYQVKDYLMELQRTYPNHMSYRPIGAGAWTGAFAQQARYETIANLMSIAVAAHKYQRAQGSFPERLQNMSEVLGGTLPLEPFSGKDYRYKRTDDGFVLEAIAPVWKTRIGDGVVMKWP